MPFDAIGCALILYLIWMGIVNRVKAAIDWYRWRRMYEETD